MELNHQAVTSGFIVEDIETSVGPYQFHNVTLSGKFEIIVDVRASPIT